jgi:hypothetical protein
MSLRPTDPRLLLGALRADENLPQNRAPRGWLISEKCPVRSGDGTEHEEGLCAP